MAQGPCSGPDTSAAWLARVAAARAEAGGGADASQAARVVQPQPLLQQLIARFFSENTHDLSAQTLFLGLAPEVQMRVVNQGQLTGSGTDPNPSLELAKRIAAVSSQGSQTVTQQTAGDEDRRGKQLAPVTQQTAGDEVAE